MCLCREHIKWVAVHSVLLGIHTESSRTQRHKILGEMLHPFHWFARYEVFIPRARDVQLFCIVHKLNVSLDL